ncbi:tungsten ABC transporter substrate-binding protein [Methanoculleus taiwanensis]|uniref:Tungsten ABC transporter substrate-binding protein n=1 Tax=Methanoculleus taiwanensis TaxID=1550565 RepID=A0A498H684_9EURY|nr:tungstate ABC transporter substrate-binding protein WtpA [Methanoculleus taiwanensis]RXE57340.1 tungsten ABC transporter substrate-binding protein [Methanoculleus taiwanensis]
MKTVLLMLCAVLLVLTAGCMGEERVTELRVVPAGSLLGPLEEIEAAYEDLHPGVDVRVEGHGSIQAVRQVTDLHRAVDVVAVADASLIPDMMFRPMEDGSGNYTDTCTPFATNEMVIAYTEKSLYADEITRENWYTILARPDVRVGFSNPMLDACGYRALMVTALAEEHYGNRALFDAIIGDHLDPRPAVNRSGGTVAITLPEVLRPSDGKVQIRDGSIYLLSLLDAGGIDYAFEYRSVADAHGLSSINLPPEIDLSSAAYTDTYRNVTVQLGFQRFGSIGSLRTGAPIVYALTVPATAEHPEKAASFVAFMLEAFEKGRDGWPQPLG